MELKKLIDVAAGRQPADLVLRGGRVVNVLTNEITEGDVAIVGSRIAGVGHYDGRQVVDLAGRWVCPGFIDAHVHIESSLLSVPEFSKVVVPHGTVAVISDPHEIANVLGVEGIRYMVSSARGCPLDVYVMLSSCVPASGLEGAGAVLSADLLAPLLNEPRILGLAEMMNYPGVVAADPEVLKKLAISQDRVIDGHCPGLTGRPLQAYIATGIGSDHECTTLEEAREKLRSGMFIMIREGSQARNLEQLLPLVSPHTVDRCMWATDDKDVDDLLEEGHIDHIIRKAIARGLEPLLAIRMATLSPARYFGLRRLGAVAPGYRASLAILEDLQECQVQEVYHDGHLVARDGRCVVVSSSGTTDVVPPNTMNLGPLNPRSFVVSAPPSAETCKVRIIQMIEDQLVTNHDIESLPVVDGAVTPDPRRDLAKIVVIERHQASGRVGIGFIRGFGLQAGAMASTVAHDAHNLVVVGVGDRDIHCAAAHLAALGGGLCVVRDGKVLADMPLPIAGLMSAATAEQARAELRALHRAAAELGCSHRKPFMGLSFMSLSVIGALKVTDHGVIDVEQFKAVPVVV